MEPKAKFEHEIIYAMHKQRVYQLQPCFQDKYKIQGDIYGLTFIFCFQLLKEPYNLLPSYLRLIFIYVYNRSNPYWSPCIAKAMVFNLKLIRPKVMVATWFSYALCKQLLYIIYYTICTLLIIIIFSNDKGRAILWDVFFSSSKLLLKVEPI